MSDAVSIAASGLHAAVLRFSNAASNIANAWSDSGVPSSGGTPAGTYAGYRPQDVVTLSGTGGGAQQGVTSVLRARTPAYVLAAGPVSPNADAHGLVATPNVDPAVEMISAKEAQLSYGADAKVIRTAEGMQKTLLDMLG